MEKFFFGNGSTNKFLINLKKIILALQHLIAMFGATVLVPLLTGFNVNTTLFCAGIGTLIFHFCTKKKVPVFLGSSFAFIPVIQSVYNNYGSLSYAQGGIAVAGFLYVILSFVIGKVGANKIIKYFPAQVVGPMIIVIGFNLIPTAISMASSNYLVSGVTLVFCLTLSFFTEGFLKQLSIIISVIIGYILSLNIGLVDMSAVRDAAILSLPQFSAPKFDIPAIIVIAPVVLAVFMEHIGDITTNSAVVGENFLEDPGLNRTLLGDGLATMVAGFLGGPANTTYGENTGVLAITKNYDPSILRITAIFAIMLGCVGKVGGLLQTIPQAVMGGISVVLFSMIALIGIKTIKNSKINFNLKNIIIMLSIIIIGLGSHVGINIAIKITEEVSLSGLSLAALVGVILNIILSRFEDKINRDK
ncbi:uracil-xanthine permease family protein [Peptoniphilus mikwangii]|uniref:uracil-xanthine permease family protein n=1 Tax=Peptoniphilus mikwangii TaxID=1354300 RepID=UPI0003F4BF41|nr:uracil-xanthine permease family protein [Peptoniphilus mikwangii]